jgi:hypothetical protein
LHELELLTLAALTHQGGEYAVGLLVGDPSAARSFFWDMGVVELVLPAGEGGAAVDAALLQRTVATQPTNNVKPLIHHQFVSGRHALLVTTQVALQLAWRVCSQVLHVSISQAIEAQSLNVCVVLGQPAARPRQAPARCRV